MDHLPEVKLHEGPFLKVPYLADRDYDGGLFQEYPHRRGWEIKRLLSRDFSEHPREETASFLQTWLFFGTLHVILEHTGARTNASFVNKDDDGKEWIFTGDLDILVRKWAEHLNSSMTDGESKIEVLSSKIICSLTILLNMTNALYGSDTCPLSDEIILSMKVLGSTIDSAFVWYWNARSFVSWGLKDFAASRMVSQGWCPRDVALVSHHLSELAMLYASYIRRDYQQQDHSSCSDRICTVNQVDEATYQTKHTTGGCQCSHVEPDQDQIRKILAKGQVPVISLTPRTAPDGSKTLDVGIKSYKYLRWFVAVSHVWSDGLGNSRKNSLPMCQLQALYELVVDKWWDRTWETLEGAFDVDDPDSDPEPTGKWEQRVIDGSKKMISATKNLVNSIRDYRGRPISIWIDTLCVPLDKDFRKIAIAKLKIVYSAAMFTIVLDSELQRTSCLCSAEENLMRIAISGWMRRAWTFQEGVLANVRLRVKFSDGLVDLALLLGDENGPDDVYIDMFLTQNPRFSGIAQAWMRKEVEFDGDNMRDKKAKKEADWKKNYNMSSYMIEEARTFFSYMRKVWLMPFRVDTSADTVKLDKVTRIAAAWMGLRWRETSRKEDKFPIFATACVTTPHELDNVQTLLSYPDHGRMKLWLSQQFAIPAGFLFIMGRRYQEDGWGWAPLSITSDDIIDDTAIGRKSGDTTLEVSKPGFILSLPGIMTGPGFVFVGPVEGRMCNVKLDNSYSEVIEARSRPPLPVRQSKMEISLNKQHQAVFEKENPPPLPKRPARKEAPPLPPRPTPVPNSSSQFQMPLASSDSFTKQKPVSCLSLQSESTLTLQPSSTGQRKGSKRRIPFDGEIFALILSRRLELDEFNNAKTSGALMTVNAQSKDSISGLFICSVTVEIFDSESVSKLLIANVVQTMDDNQVWRVG